MKINNKFIQKYGSPEDMMLPLPTEEVEEVHIPASGKIPTIEEIEPESLRDRFYIHQENPQKHHGTIPAGPKALKKHLEPDPELADTEILVDNSPETERSLVTPTFEFDDPEVASKKAVSSAEDLIKLCEAYFNLTIK